MSVTATPAGGAAPAKGNENTAARMLMRRHRLRWWETLPWLAGIAFYFAAPDYLGFGCDLLVTILFALSLDLALGYAGIITLGHAAFFGVGAYTVGMLATYNVWTEPITSLLLAAIAAGAPDRPRRDSRSTTSVRFSVASSISTGSPAGPGQSSATVSAKSPT